MRKREQSAGYADEGHCEAKLQGAAVSLPCPWELRQGGNKDEKVNNNLDGNNNARSGKNRRCKYN